MHPSEVSFQTYLRREVATSGRKFEQANERLLALADKPQVAPGPQLAEATQHLADSLHAYTSAMRRLANYAAHKSQSCPTVG